MARARPGDGRGAPRRRFEPGEPAITAYPSGSAEALWWSTTQIDMIGALLLRLKRTYNIDENRVHLMGVSDGGTGAYYFGIKHATPWSALFPFNGHLRVLANRDIRVEGELYLTNLVNTPAYVVNGGLDPMYPVAAVEPYLQALSRAGAPVEFHPQMQAGHDTAWWPDLRTAVDGFEYAHVRDPLPDTLSWTTDRTDYFNRFRWLVIDALGRAFDAHRAGGPLTFLVRRGTGQVTLQVPFPPSLSPVVSPIFERRVPWGRVDLVRHGNTIDARASGVGTFTLLLSPARFDFSRPVVVNVNGERVHDGLVDRDVATMLRWAARDHDRTMLFGAALQIHVPR